MHPFLRHYVYVSVWMTCWLAVSWVCGKHGLPGVTGCKLLAPLS